MAASSTLHQVVLFEDDADVRGAITQSLALAGLKVSAFGSAGTVPERIGPDFAGVVVSDIRLPGRDGRDIFRSIHDRAPQVPVILITGHAQVQEAVDLVREGAFDFLSKPFSADRLTNSVKLALEQRLVSLESRDLVDRGPAGVVALRGDHARMASLRTAVTDVADTELNVLIIGETGTGKGMVAKAIHDAGRRSSKPFVILDCASLPENLLEAELFGTESLISGMTRRRPGRLDAAERGTLLLDNVDALSPLAQGRLLRAVEDKEITSLGGTLSRQLSCRIIAAATRIPNGPSEQSPFNPALYYRLSEVVLTLPPLRERREDLTMLYTEMMRASAPRLRRAPLPLTPAIRGFLMSHPWAGNLRELRHYAERLLLGLDGLDSPPAVGRESLHDRVGRFEAESIKDALRATGGDVRKCLELLDLPRKTFYDKVARFGIDLESFRSDNGRPTQ